MSDTEEQSPVEKPTKANEKKDWIMTEARRISLEKGRKLREENILNIQRNKAVRQIEQRKQKLNEKATQIIEGLIPAKQKRKPASRKADLSELANLPELEQKTEEPPQLKEEPPIKKEDIRHRTKDAVKQKKPKKQVVLYESESEEEESETSSSSSIELIIKRKAKNEKPQVYQQPKIYQQSHFFI